MDNDKVRLDVQQEVTGQSARRRFLLISGRAAVAAPAVALLLAAESKGAHAQVVPYQPTPGIPE